LTLEESIARYEEGVRLSKRLTQTLDEAEKRIERLVQNEDGTTGTAPMELDEGNGGERRGAPGAGERRGPAAEARGPSRGASAPPEELPF
jgi:hypothetical protein